MSCFKLKIYCISFLLISSYSLLYPGYTLARRVREGNSMISIEDREHCEGILEGLDISTTERNIQLFLSLKAVAEEVGDTHFHFLSTSSINLLHLVKAGILTDSTFPYIVELGKRSFRSGFDPWTLFSNTLPSFAKAGMLKKSNLEEIGNKLLKLGKSCIEAEFSPYSLFDSLSRFTITESNLEKISNKLVKIGKSCVEAGFDPYYLLTITLPSFAKAGMLTVSNLEKKGKKLVDIGEASKKSKASSDISEIYKKDLPNLIESKILTKFTFPYIVELSKVFGEGNKSVHILLREVLPALDEAGILKESTFPHIVKLAKAGFKKRNTYVKNVLQFYLPRLAEAGILTKSTLPQIIELGITGYEAGKNVEDLYNDGLTALDETGILTDSTFSYIVELGKRSFKSGFSPSILFKTVLPYFYKVGILTDPSLTESNLEEIGNKLVKLGESCIEVGFDPYYLFRYTVPWLAYGGILRESNLTEAGGKLVELGKTGVEAKKKIELDVSIDKLFQYAFPHLVETGILTKSTFPYIVELAKRSFKSGFDSYSLLRVTLPSFAEAGILKESNLEEIGNKLLKIGKSCVEAGFDPYYLLTDTLPSFAKAGILTESNLEEKSQRLVNLGEVGVKVGFSPRELGGMWRSLPRLVKSGILTKFTFPKIVKLVKSCIEAGFRPDNKFLGHVENLKNYKVNEKFHIKIIDLAISKFKEGKNGGDWITSIAKSSNKPYGINVALRLSEADFLPSEKMIDLILEEGGENPLSILDDKIQEFSNLREKLKIRLPDLDKVTELVIYYSLIQEKINSSIKGYNRYQEMLAEVNRFLQKHPEFKNSFELKNYKQFNVVGEVVTYSDEVASTVDTYIETIKNTHQALVNLKLNNIIEDEFGKLEDPLDFYKRVLGYLVYQTSPNPPGKIKNRTLTNFIDGVYKSEWVEDDISRLFETSNNIDDYKQAILKLVEAKGKNIKLIDAIFSVSLLGYQPADKSERKRLAYLMIESIIAARLEEEDITSALEESEYDVKLQILDDIYHRHSLKYILDRVNIQIDVPEVVESKLHSRQEAIWSITQEGVEVSESTDTYTIIPIKFDGIFRGYTFLDCSRKDSFGYPYVWTVHPDNMYYLVKKNGRVNGYIGLSETKVKGTDKKVLLIDTLQFHGQEEMVRSILNALEQQAKDLGFKGIALPKSLSASFNSEPTTQIVKSLLGYRKGKVVELEYIHQKETQALIEKYGEDEYHSLFASDEFILLTSIP